MAGLNSQGKVVGIEQDSGETERERGEGDRVSLQMRDGVSNKIDCWRKYLQWI
jgi:hypothetical protein